ncbi:Transposon IS605 OrfB [Methylacidiphilum infernorum V4]|uniref:Transposon IS605 OrfB n=1 Tax=Methylacidiphilum infernorum (isolate V4) TaxID=481448 RepID=B3DY17_METI4|nr:Transposon IS605 OrfB [Methylacidiphilum infernorum V4]
MIGSLLRCSFLRCAFRTARARRAAFVRLPSSSGVAVLIAHKIVQDPNKKQADCFARGGGNSPLCRQLGLGQKMGKRYEAWGKDASIPKPLRASLQSLLNALEHNQYPWMPEAAKCAPKAAIIQSGNRSRTSLPDGSVTSTLPKKAVRDRFTLTSRRFEGDGLQIRIPKIGWERMFQVLRFTGKIMSAASCRHLRQVVRPHRCGHTRPPCSYPQPKTKARWAWIRPCRPWQGSRLGRR